MPHRPQPFYRSARSAWYVQLGKRQLKLVGGPKNAATEEAAWQAFHKLMATQTPGQSAHFAPTTTSDRLTLAEVFEKYLDWCQKNRSSRTYEWSQKHIQSFCDHIGTARSTAASNLRPFHIVEWVDSKATWGANQKRGAIVAVQRPLNWAAKLGYITKNPVAGVEKPKAERREEYINPSEFTQLLTHYKVGDPFRDLLAFLWETGCRPQEARHVELRHLVEQFRRFDIPPEEAKGKKRWRVIRLNDTAWEIVKRRAPRANVKVFENQDGKPWTADAINCRFQRLKRSKGLAHFAYALRHGFCQRKLEEGHDHLTVAELMGHSNGAMVAQVYSHLNKAEEHLRKALD